MYFLYLTGFTQDILNKKLIIKSIFIIILIVIIIKSAEAIYGLFDSVLSHELAL